MKKIIAAIDGLKYSDSTVDYAVHLSKQGNAHLVGIFLDDFTYHSYKIHEFAGKENSVAETLEEKDKKTREQSTINFEKWCREAGVNFSLHHDRSIALQELLHESIYADLLILNNQETLTHYKEKKPSRFVKDLLSEVQCPVLLVPQSYEPIDKIILLYDGEPGSVYAIRTFSYVFPMLKYLPTEVLFVKNTKETSHVPDNRLMKEFMRRHYPKAEYTVLNGNPGKEIPAYLGRNGENILIVLGAYGRGLVSRSLKPSIADTLMKQLKVPLFVAHNK